MANDFWFASLIGIQRGWLPLASQWDAYAFMLRVQRNLVRKSEESEAIRILATQWFKSVTKTWWSSVTGSLQCFCLEFCWRYSHRWLKSTFNCTLRFLFLFFGEFERVEFSVVAQLIFIFLEFFLMVYVYRPGMWTVHFHIDSQRRCWLYVVL